MVEGGSRILSAFLSAELVDELIVYVAPTLLGSGTPALNGLGIRTLADAQQWEWDASDGGAVRTLGRDLRLHLRPQRTVALDPQPARDPQPSRGSAEQAQGGY
jgi:diaminohydroxyphosphoribosylaminopyrimidine deaminase/5-amino-6-(5-phosphoribosylamino)uracil reductase